MRPLAALLMLTLPANADVITYHPGGTKMETAHIRTQPVVINGTCRSACAWSAWANPKMCYGPKAEFYFHSHEDPGTKAKMPIATQWWLEQVPSWVRPELTVTAKTLAKLEPNRRCPEKARKT